MASDATAKDALAILDLPMEVPNDAGAATVREYLVALLEGLWTRGEGFSGKRPFGNSGWRYNLYRALVAAGYISGSFDEDSYFNDVHGRYVGDELLLMAIRSLGEGEPGSW